MPTILIVPIGAVVILAGFMFLIWRGRVEYRRVADELGTIEALPGEEAKRRAYALLEDAGVFRCSKAVAPFAEIKALLPRGVRDVFAQYSSVETAAGPPIRIERALVTESPSHPGYTVIGKGLEGTDVRFELGVRVDGEAVYELCADEAPDPVYGTHTTVYHWILATGREVEKAKRAR